jgi:hypothetical protein
LILLGKPSLPLSAHNREVRGVYGLRVVTNSTEFLSKRRKTKPTEAQADLIAVVLLLGR